MLSRFRADPRKVRAAIRRDGNEWVASISNRGCLCNGGCFSARATGPRKALVKALLLADEHDVDGVDLSMGWAYEHPQHAHS
jgi:hypothetical protein